jgi:hypothetical protein
VLPGQVIHTIAAAMAVDMRGRVLVGEFESGAELYRVEVEFLAVGHRVRVACHVGAPGSLQALQPARLTDMRQGL